MSARVARWVAMAGNMLLTGSLLLLLVWWQISLKLFAAGWVLYGVAWCIERAVANETFELARPTGPSVER